MPNCVPMFSKSGNNELCVILNSDRFNNSVDVVEKETNVVMISAVT